MRYPGGIRKQNGAFNKHKNIVYGNRGMDLESDINLSNQYYREVDKAIIYKKPTPIKISEVDYKAEGKVIRKAFFESPSTTDYNGVYRGRYIDFEAKETKSSTSFPLKNIHAHQIKHMMQVTRHGGICFLIVRFVHLGATYLLPSEALEQFLHQETRSSIPLEYFYEHATLLEDGYLPRIDYLKVIDQIYGGVLNGEENDQ